MGRPLLLLLKASFLLVSVYLAGAYDFYVGGRNGWVLKPKESYNLWSSRRRFLVNDNLIFKYKKGANSVLLVKKEDYDSCNVNNPIKKFDDGNTVFVFDRTGPFFFIDGDSENCGKGQKLLVVVLSARKKNPSPPIASSPPSPAPSEASSSPSVSPVSAPAAKPPISSPPVSPLSPPSLVPPEASSSPSVSPVSAPATKPQISSPSISPSSPPSPEALSSNSPEQSPSSNSPSASSFPPKAQSPSSNPEFNAVSPSSSAAGIVVSRSVLGMLALLLWEVLLI